ncbi:MAG: FAD-binding protein [Planctomycetia bacterium]|nr:FAD-binding protein [Planctomycetia bacterium]
MKTVVCVKIIKGEINPFDAAALEAALRADPSEITVLCMGPMIAQDPLRALTRLGNLRVILLSDLVFAGSDTLATAQVLSAAIRKLDPDLIFCGRQSIDGDTAQVGPCLAAKLDWNLIANVLKFGSENCETRTGSEPVAIPSVLTFERIYPLRFPSLRSKIGEIEIWDNKILGIDPARCGLAGSPTRVRETFESDRGRRKCRFISRSELEPLIRDLLQKPNRKRKIAESKKKFPAVWAVGHEVEKEAFAIADQVIFLEKESPKIIAEKVKKEKPEVVLWNADLWGRKTAPQVAGILDLGLAADCTMLETDGKILSMYRPAFEARLLAKVESLARPQMATVRTTEISGKLIAAAGRGVAAQYDQIRRFADHLGAEFAASRGLVDEGIAPYEMQIGLTGRQVAPKIYLAIGISGAVHHTCAIENAEYIIAINKDKDARIFDYADFGVIEEF